MWLRSTTISAPNGATKVMFTPAYSTSSGPSPDGVVCRKNGNTSIEYLLALATTPPWVRGIAADARTSAMVRAVINRFIGVTFVSFAEGA